MVKKAAVVVLVLIAVFALIRTYSMDERLTQVERKTGMRSDAV
jgi:hypothetical protein